MVCSEHFHSQLSKGGQIKYPVADGGDGDGNVFCGVTTVTAADDILIQTRLLGFYCTKP